MFDSKVVVSGRAFLVRRLCAYNQFSLLRRLSSILPALFHVQSGHDGQLRSLREALKVLTPLLAAPDEDIDAIFADCREALMTAEGHTPSEAFSLGDMLSIVREVASVNFGPLFALDRPSFRPVARDVASFGHVTMPNGKDWLFRPVLRGMCKFESLRDGTLHLEDVAEMNDALDVADENETRLRKAAEKR